jgi:NADH-quinone oxidoreductase subunit M
MDFPLLPIITFTPAATAVVLLLIPQDRKTEVRMTALAGAFISMALSIYAYFAYDVAAAEAATTWADKLQFVFGPYPWLETVGISLYMGADGLSLSMAVLTGIVAFTGVLISWGIDDRPREFFAFMMLLATGVFGVFVSLDLFQIFFAYELAVFPMYVLIVIWGWKVTREYAAMKLTLYLLIGSVIALVGVLAIYFSPSNEVLESVGLCDAGGCHRTFNLVKMSEMAASGLFSKPVPFLGREVNFENLWFLPVFLGFAVLAGIWPLHSWSPDGHVAAPTAVSMFHAGVLMKLGAYAAMRIGIQLLPNGARDWLPMLVFLTVVNVVYGSLIAFVQKDFKYVIGFSSVSHMGLVSMAFATMTTVGYVGGGMQMFSHGIMTALFFAVVGIVYDRAHTRQIPELGGMAKVLPWTAVAFIVGGLVSMGMPGFSGFTAELPIFMGVWQAGETVAGYYRIIAILSATGIVITAAYVLRVVQRVFFGEYEGEKWHDMRPSTATDKIALVILVSILILVGVYPQIMAPLIRSAVTPLVNTLGGGV